MFPPMLFYVNMIIRYSLFHFYVCTRSFETHCISMLIQNLEYMCLRLLEVFLLDIWRFTALFLLIDKYFHGYEQCHEKISMSFWDNSLPNSDRHFSRNIFNKKRGRFQSSTWNIKKIALSPVNTTYSLFFCQTTMYTFRHINAECIFFHFLLFFYILLAFSTSRRFVAAFMFQFI